MALEGRVRKGEFVFSRADLQRSGIGHMAAILLGPRPPFLVRLRRAWRVLRHG